MRRTLETWRVKLMVRLGWRNRGAVAEAIQGFTATEADGVWHLHRGLARIRDPKQRAILFTHSLEEEAHAEAFAATYAQYADRAITPPSFEREDLYPATAPAWKTIAYVHVGEDDATERFRAIAQALDDGPLRQVITRVVGDEDGHVGLTHRMLLQLGATESQIRNEAIRVRMKRAWEAWLRNGQRVVDWFATGLLSTLYFVLGPFFTGAARRKLAARYVDYDNAHVKSLTS